MRRADDTHIYRFFIGGPQLTHPALLNRAQQFHLHRQRQIGHLIKQQSAAVCGLEKTIPLISGPSKRTLAVAEKFRLHQCFRDRAAIDCHERLANPCALGMNFPCHHLLAATRFTRNGNRCH